MAIELSTQNMNASGVPKFSEKTKEFFFRRVTRVMFGKYVDRNCNLVLMIDNRERPGQSTQLRKRVCNLAEAGGMNYSVQQLVVGDYIFLLAFENLIMPLFILYERKSATDFAMSMRDGRLKKQLRAMLRIKKIVMDLAPELREFVEVNLILEGSFDEKAIMSDGKRYVGEAKKSPTVEQCEARLQDLEQWNEINVIKVDSMEKMTREVFASRYKLLKAKQLQIYNIYKNMNADVRDNLAFKRMKELLGNKQSWPDIPWLVDFVPEEIESAEYGAGGKESADVRQYKSKLREMGVHIDSTSVEDIQNALVQHGTLEMAINAAVSVHFS